VVVLGLILLIIGFVLGVPALWTIGLILLVIGAILFLLGALGREVGGLSLLVLATGTSAARCRATAGGISQHNSAGFIVATRSPRLRSPGHRP
jgi:hypothetical protein